MVRSTIVGTAVGFVLAALLIGLFAVSNGVSEDLYAPILAMALPIVLIGALVGLYSRTAGLRTVPRTLARWAIIGALLAIVALVLRLTGIL